jgi:hypothetical protein
MKGRYSVAAAIRRVTKGPWISELNNRFGGTPEHFMPNYRATLQILKGNGGAPSLAELAADRVGENLAGHFRDHWLQEWWPEAQPIEPILRAGLIEAIERGLAARLPLDALWVQATERQFEIGIGQSSTQITLLILTPPAPDDGGGGPDEPTYMTLVFRDGNEIVTEESRGN